MYRDIPDEGVDLCAIQVVRTKDGFFYHRLVCTGVDQEDLHGTNEQTPKSKILEKAIQSKSIATF